MTDIAQEVKKSEKKKAISKTSKTDETLIKDAKERIMRLQKKTKKNPASETKTKLKMMKKTKKNPNRRGVVYLGHIPHGFYEEELRGFFSQFGKVSRVKVSRSSKTGRSKGYAFIEFAYNDVAKIVAETMNNYLMFERLVKAQYIPPEKVHSNLFPVHFMTPESYPTLLRRNRVMAKQEKPSTEEDKKKHRSRIQFKIGRAISALKELGIDHHPQIYDPEAGRHGEISHTNDDEVPQLVEIQNTITESKQSKKMKVPQKRNTNAMVAPVADSKSKKLTEVTTNAVAGAVQPTTPERKSLRATHNQRQATLQKNKAEVIEMKPTPDSTPATLTETDKVLKLEQKVSLKKQSTNIIPESSKGKRKGQAVSELIPATNVAASQSPSKRSKSTTSSPTKTSGTLLKKNPAKSSPKSVETTGKAKSLVKIAVPSKLPVRSVKGKKPV